MTAGCVASVTTVPRSSSTTHAAPALYVPTCVGVVLLSWTSVYTWRRGAKRPRAFVVVRGRAFLILPDRATIRTVALLLACDFPVGSWIIDARHPLKAIGWVSVGLAVVIVPAALLHAVFLWRGKPRPLVEITSAGVTARGLFGSVHAPWSVFESDYNSWPTRRMRLRLPIYERRGLKRRGLRPRSVKLPTRYRDPLSLSATWNTNPWWAAQALCSYWRSPYNRGEIGTGEEYSRLVSFVNRYKSEIDDQLHRFS